MDKPNGVAKPGAASEIPEDQMVYGNRDDKKEFAFPYGERDYFILRTSRGMETPSQVVMEDPGSIEYKKYNQAQWAHTSQFNHLGLQGLNVNILHDPTLDKEVQL